MNLRPSTAYSLPYPLLLVPAVLGMALAGCGECPAIDCVPTIAITVKITAGGAPGPVSGAFINLSGASTPAAWCNPAADATVCQVPGGSGTYNLEVGAPGFQTTHRTVNVHEYETGGCGCAGVTTEYLAIVLVPNP